MPDKFLPPPIFTAVGELQLHGTPNKRVADKKLTKGGCRSGDSTPTPLTTSWSLPNQLANHLCPACPEEVGPLVPEDPGSDSAWETWSSLGSSSSSGANSSGSTTDALSGCAWTEALTPCSAQCHRSYHRLWGVPEHHCKFLHHTVDFTAEAREPATSGGSLQALQIRRYCSPYQVPASHK